MDKNIASSQNQQLAAQLLQQQGASSGYEPNPALMAKKAEGQNVLANFINQVQQEGMQEGMQRGMQEGMQEGLQTGMKAGIGRGMEAGYERGADEGRMHGRREGMDFAAMLQGGGIEQYQ